jgi:hypothetical protein
MRIFKQRKRVKTQRPELHEPDSEFTPSRSEVEEEEITETLTKIDNVLSNLNNHTW